MIRYIRQLALGSFLVNNPLPSPPKTIVISMGSLAGNPDLREKIAPWKERKT
jgi:hypothetical protein